MIKYRMCKFSTVLQTMCGRSFELCSLTVSIDHFDSVRIANFRMRTKAFITREQHVAICYLIMSKCVSALQKFELKANIYPITCRAQIVEKIVWPPHGILNGCLIRTTNTCTALPGLCIQIIVILCHSIKNTS